MGDRKARLAALAAKAGRAKPTEEETGGDNDQTDVVDTTRPQSLSFRNYAPHDDSLEKKNQDEGEEESPSKRSRMNDGNPNLSSSPSSSVLQEALLQAKQELAASSIKGKITKVEETVATPKKINWDLKRDIQDKMKKLEKRTQKAIVEMLKERLEKEAAEQAESGESDLD